MKEKREKRVLLTNEKIKKPDLKIVYGGKRYNVSLQSVIPTIEAPEFVNYVSKCIDLHEGCSKL